MTARHALTFAAVLCALFGAACGGSKGDGIEPADRAFRDFQAIYPILARDCGFHNCHGSEDRFFHIYAPGRARLDSDTRAFDAVTGFEASASFTSALSFIDAEDPARSLLLRKPLAVAAGGASHEGVDAFGRDVYRSANDEGYLAIAGWVLTAAEE
ncbi:MAG: hypothetical protein OEZ06_08345 [Myxococcales bacterium]|nr:hypothetical protein [Myxococcales bacterium]